MTFREYLRMIRRRWLLILGTLVAVMAIAFGITAQMTPQYSSTARVFFISTATSGAGDTYQDNLSSGERVASYTDVIGGLELSQRVINRLDLKMSAPDLAEKIIATVVPNTVVIKIDVIDPSPAQARRINRGVIAELQELVQELETPPGRALPLVKATVVDAPQLPDAPVSPEPLRNLGLGLILGLLLGVGLALLREMLDTTVKQLEDVPALRETPLLSSLALDKAVRDRPLITDLNLNAPRSEAFRVLRTNLAFVDVDQAAKVFVITSSLPSEGKSTIAANAAIAIAQAGERVLLIDGDLRRPRIADMLGLEPTVGLTTVLVGRTTLDESLQEHAASGLTVLTAGQVPPNPSELLQSKAMRELLKVIRGRFDVTIIDTPPLLPVTDAAVLAAETDGAVLVVRHSTTRRDQVNGAVDRLLAVGSAPIGVILNMVAQRGLGKDYGNTYGYGSEGDSTLVDSST